MELQSMHVDLLEKIWNEAFLGSSICMPPNRQVRDEYWHPFWVKYCLHVIKDAPKSRQDVLTRVLAERASSMASSQIQDVKSVNAMSVEAKSIHSLMDTAKYMFIAIVLKQHKNLVFGELYLVCYNICSLNAYGRLHHLLHKFLAITFRYHHKTDKEYMMLAFKMLEDITLHLNKICPQKGLRTARQTIDAFIAVMNETDDVHKACLWAAASRGSPEE